MRSQSGVVGGRLWERKAAELDTHGGPKRGEGEGSCNWTLSKKEEGRGEEDRKEGSRRSKTKWQCNLAQVAS